MAAHDSPNPVDSVERTPGEHGFLVVGIGASAGGVQALSEFFSNVRPDAGIAYVAILHLSPDHDSHLADVLQHVTKMPVEQVTKQTRIQPDHVYVVPPDKNLSMKDGSIVVKPIKTVEERRAPVDIFFRTLAESHGQDAVGVVLSGTGANGSMGIKRIKEFGGATFAQNPREAEFNEMPRNSIATEFVDMILPVAKIPGHIVKYRDRVRAISIPEEPNERNEDQQSALRDIFTQLRVRTGHDFSNYKRPTMLRRIERRISVKDLPDLKSYANHLREQPEEANALLKDLLISVTNFFRDKKTFDALESKVLPTLVAGATHTRPVRIWVAGCATGEEAYSIAMMAAELTSGSIDGQKIQIFATDIDERAIASAREGVYTLNDAADVSPERLRRFFSKEGEYYRVRREIREMVLFAQHNLIKDPPFSRLDLITCRNLLIYLNHAAQERVLKTIHFALNPGGYLCIGSSESVDGASDLFLPVDKENHIFRSRHVAVRPFPVPESVPMYRAMLPSSATGTKRAGDGDRITYNDLHLRLVEELAPPSVVVNEEYDIVHISPSAGKYMMVAGGEPTNNLLKLIRPEIRLEVRTALFQATQQKSNVEVKNLKVGVKSHEETINLLVRPVVADGDTARGFILVVFEPSPDADSGIAGREAGYVPPEPVARQLEEELVRSRAQLQSALEQSEIQSEELRASNEELQAMNEELRSSAEELETSKEELQSINEELTTVNQELKVKIEELSQTNNNFANLLNSIDIAVIFLDRGLRVNLFSPAATRIFNLIGGDIGRPLSDITSKLEQDGFAKEAGEVMENLQAHVREVNTLDGQVYEMHAFPYRTTDDRINGVVLTFVDVTERARSRQAIADSEEQFRGAIEDAPIPVIMHAEDGEVLQISRTWTRLTGYTIKDVRTFDSWVTRACGQVAGAVRAQMKELYKGHKVSLDFEFPVLTLSGDVRHWTFSASSPGTLRDGRRFIVGMALDITERKLTEIALLESEARLRSVMESLTDIAIFTTDEKGIVTSWNPGSEKIFGYSAEEMIGKESADIIFTPEDREKGAPQEERKNALLHGKAIDQRWHLRKNGERFFASGYMAKLSQSGKNFGFGKIAQDLTARTQGEKAIRESAMLRRLTQAQEDERRRIARDLHDHLGQLVTGLRLKLEGLKANYSAEPAMMKAIDETQALGKKLDDDISFLAWELRPTVLDNLGLKAALANYVSEWSKNYGIATEFHSARISRKRLTQETEISLYRIAQEALNNVLKHAKATKVDVVLELGKKDIVLIVEDNGIGFDPSGIEGTTKPGKGLGIIGMRERAQLLGGSLEIESTRLKGSAVIARVPTRLIETTNK